MESVTYGGTTVLVASDASEPQAVYLERSWCIAKAIERGSRATPAELVNLARFYAYKKTLGVTYSAAVEKRLAEVFG